jgi:hypothetical protein
VDARGITTTTIIKLALLMTGWQRALEVVAVGLGAGIRAGRSIKEASTMTTGILRERKWRQQSSEAIGDEGQECHLGQLGQRRRNRPTQVVFIESYVSDMSTRAGHSLTTGTA